MVEASRDGVHRWPPSWPPRHPSDPPRPFATGRDEAGAGTTRGWDW